MKPMSLIESEYQSPLRPVLATSFVFFNDPSISLLSVLMVAAGPIARRFLGCQRQILWYRWPKKMIFHMRRKVEGLVILGPVNHDDDGDDAGGADDGGFDFCQ